MTGDLPVAIAADVRLYTEQKLQQQAALVRKQKTAPLQLLAVEGSVVEAILETARELQADMIVAGMKGEGKGFRKVFGNIALGNDIDTETDIHLLDPLREIVLPFNSTLFVIRVIKKKADEVIEVLKRRTNLAKMLESLNTVYEYPLDKDVGQAISRFADSHKVSMLVMLPHPHFLPERWFIKSNTREILFEARVPVLIVPEPVKTG